MNKIKIDNNEIKLIEQDSSIECKYIPKTDNDVVSYLKIKVVSDTDLELEINGTYDNKIDVFINVLSDVKLELNEYLSGNDVKIQYKYYIEEAASINIKKINNVDGIRECDIFNLNGSGAKVKRVLKTISNEKEKYDILVYHNASKTSSDLINHGVNINDGELVFNVSSFVLKDMNNSYLNQSNRIINLTDHECKINPNMYIDCFDVIANHSAFIGKFKDEELFYLQSRGIKEIDATKLLIKGFLTSHLGDEQKERYNETIDKYWR